MNTLQKTMENWFTAVAYADAGQPGWTDDLWTINGKAQPSVLKQLLIFGAGSILMYVLAFTNADAFAALCAKGGLWTALPIASVLLLSYVHGHFAGALWELCGITGVQKKAAKAEPKTATRKALPPRPASTPRQWFTASSAFSTGPGCAAARLVSYFARGTSGLEPAQTSTPRHVCPWRLTWICSVLTRHNS